MVLDVKAVTSPEARQRKLDIGAVVEIPTPSGFGYVQYTHWNELMGAMVRVLPGLHHSRPSDLEALVNEPEVYVTFVPLREAISAGMFHLVGRADVPKRARRFPLFRAAGPRKAGTGEPSTWGLWDGKKETKVGSLSLEQEKLPERSTLMPPVLIARLEAGWRPGDPHPNAVPIAEGPMSADEPGLCHYLYFPDEESARRAVSALSEAGMKAEAELSARGAEWLVRASARKGQTFEEARARLEDLASKLRGEYDGWESG
jgi:hypothetical protein